MASNKPSCLQFLAGLLLLGSLLFGSVVLGMIVTGTAAPDSQTARVIGFFMLPVSLGLALISWWGTAVALITFKIAQKAATTRSLAEGFAHANRVHRPPGSWVLLIIPAAVCLIAGAIIAFLGPMPPLFTVLLHTATGMGYGLALFLLARHPTLNQIFTTLFDSMN